MVHTAVEDESAYLKLLLVKLQELLDSLCLVSDTLVHAKLSVMISKERKAKERFAIIIHRIQKKPLFHSKNCIKERPKPNHKIIKVNLDPIHNQVA